MRVLITGGAAGLGAALVEGMVHRGHEVLVVDHDAERLKELPRGVGTIVADLANTASLAGLVDTMSPGGPFDVAIMNAGTSATGPFEHIPDRDHRKVIAVNLLAPMALTALLLQRGLVSDGGSLIYISSLSHFLGYPGASVYAGTKDGIAIFARSLRKALRRRSIKVLTVFPGPLDTEHAQRYAPPGADRGRRMPPRVAAELIIAHMRTSGTVIPGFGHALLGKLGWLAPTLATAFMRRIIFEKLHVESHSREHVLPTRFEGQECNDDVPPRSAADA